MAYEVEPRTASQFAANNPASLWTPGLGAIHTEFVAETFSAAAQLVGAFGQAADRLDHHPEIHIRYPGVVGVSVSTHAVGGLSDLDERLAREFSTIAEKEGCRQQRAVMSLVEIAIDTVDADQIRPFWAAAMGYRVDRYNNLVDPRGLGPSIWFQQMDSPRTDRNRLHLDVTVAPEDADGRVANAVAAGGTLLSDKRARAFWTLADADGNEVCICTWLDRE